MHATITDSTAVSFHLFIHQSTSRWYNKNIAKTGKTATAVWNEWLTQGSVAKTLLDTYIHQQSPLISSLSGGIQGI